MKKATAKDKDAALARLPTPNLRKSKGKGKVQHKQVINVTEAKEKVLGVAPLPEVQISEEKKKEIENLPSTKILMFMVDKLINYDIWMREDVFPRLKSGGQLSVIAKYTESMGMYIIVARNNKACGIPIVLALSSNLFPHKNAINKGLHELKNGTDITKVADLFDESIFVDKSVFFTEQYKDVIAKTLRYFQCFIESFIQYKILKEQNK